SARRNVRSGGEMEESARTLLPERIGQRPIRRTQALDPDPAALEPFGRNAGAEHECAVGIALVGEQIEHRANEIRCDPRVRHVADKSRLPRIASYNFGPLIPRGRAAAGEEE